MPRLVLGVLALLAAGQPAAPTRTLVWSDEFTGPAGTKVDASRWVSETGGHGWGNHELQHYTDRTLNASLHGSGNLVISARRERFEGEKTTREFTSARLKTQGLFEQAYGRFEARIQVPRGQGIWPAFWMLGGDIKSVGWPRCGEIDVMENIGKEPGVVHGTLHGPGFSGAASLGGAFTLPGKAAFADDFHVFAVDWEPERVRFFVDGNHYHTRTRAELEPEQRWVFDHPFFILLNVAVGGDWPGNPDATTVFPQSMKIDYVRVYK